MTIRITRIEQGLLQRPHDVQVTKSSPNQSRSESAVAINPINNSNIVAASKKFIDPQKYRFTISTSYSMDGGNTWKESTLPNPLVWDGMTDPALSFDNIGNVFLVVEPLKFTVDDLVGMGMYIYQSRNGGQSWIDPTPLHPDDRTDDKQWIACDNAPNSPFVGNIYVAWGANSPLRFSRSEDHGQSWIGVGSSSSGSEIANETFAPEISVDLDGVIHIVWHIPGTDTIKYIRSTDGGKSFKPIVDAAKGITSFNNHLPTSSGFPHFPNATFRVLTLATGCGILDGKFIVAWADMRENFSRIYYRISEQNGAKWIGPESGSPMMPWLSSSDKVYNFHPQIIANKQGAIGCAYYQFGFKQGEYLIDTKLAASFSNGSNFEYDSEISDLSWNPAINAPWSHGHSDLTFIGDYFGIDAVNNSFAVLWTDTRTGIQELFFDLVATSGYQFTQELEISDTKVLTGVIDDSGGLIWVNGKVIPYPGPGPELDLLNALAALDSVKKINHSNSHKIVNSITKVMQNVIEDLRKLPQKT